MDPKPEDLAEFFRTRKIGFGRCLESTMQCDQPAIRAHSIQNRQTITLLTEQILVDLSILHNQQEILVWVGYELDVVDRVAVHHQKIGERALLNDP